VVSPDWRASKIRSRKSIEIAAMTPSRASWSQGDNQAPIVTTRYENMKPALSSIEIKA
jgi:hypothetical protein